ncbi:DUF6612 family protein [Candidatus Altiarchaeota archaeon]
MRPNKVFAVVALFVFLTGCVATSLQPTPEEIRDRTLEAVMNVSSYSFDMSMQMDVRGVRNGSEANSTLGIFGSGEVDVANQKSRLSLEMTNPQIPGGTPEGVNTTIFFIKDKVYMKLFKTWIYQKLENAEDVWEQQNQVRSQSRLLRDAELVVLPDEILGGEDTYVLKVTPDKIKVLRYMAEQSKTPELSSLTEDELANMSQNLKEFSVTQWIRKTDYLPLRFNTILVLASENSTVTMHMDMNVSDYDQLFIIEPPGDAIDVVTLLGQAPPA